MCNELQPILIDEDISLTKKEIEVLKLLAHGHTYNEVAEKLFITISTVRKHTSNILKKFNAKNTAHATALAIRHQIVK